MPGQVRARKQGYAHRHTFASFLSRFGSLGEGLAGDEATRQRLCQKHLGTGDAAVGKRHESVGLLATLVSARLLGDEGWAVGTGKVFLKAAAPAEKVALDERRAAGRWMARNGATRGLVP